MTDVATEVARAAIDAVPRLRAEVDAALLVMEQVGASTLPEARRIAAHLADLLRDVGEGRLSAADGRAAAAADLHALGLLGATAKEVAATEAALRLKHVLKIGVDLGLQLAGLALRGLI